MKDLFTRLVSTLKEKGLTISCAESCTGGLIAKSITDISGCSSVFYGGVVSYDNIVKMGILGVKEETLNTVGAVSYETAKEMALGVKRACFTDIGISTTGIAGPGGAVPGKPVGTVYIGVAINDEVESFRLDLGEDNSRDVIREKAVFEILSLLLDKIDKIYWF